MGFFRTIKNSLLSVFFGVLVCSLFVSFALHSVEFVHTHPGHAGHASETGSMELFDFNEYMHGTDKKLFLFALFSFLSLGAYVCVQFFFDTLLASMRSASFVYAIFEKKRILFREADLYRLILSQGILNSKAH